MPERSVDPTDAAIANARLARQHISRPVGDGVAGMVRRLVGVQAQDFAGSKWALGLRLIGVDDAEVERAFNAGEILRTHLLRPTWHFVTPADIRALLLLTGPRVLAQNGSMCRKLSLDALTLRRSTAAMARALEGGRHLTRDALRAVVQHAGIATDGLQRMAYIMMHAELTGVICSGALEGRQFTYALLEERVAAPPPPDRDAVLADIAGRYLTTRAPATARDFAKWAGLTIAEASRAFDALPASRPIRVPAKAPRVHLLSIYDEYISSYRDRSAIVAPAHGQRLIQQGAALAWVIVLDGRIAGTFRRVSKPRAVGIQPTLFVRLSRAERDALAAAIERYATFLGLPVTLRRESSLP
jgi:hypothetical protein